MKKVETQRKLAELRELLPPESRVLLVVHDNPDPDCVASAYGMKLVLESLKVSADAAYGGSVGRRENRALLYSMDLDLRSIFTIDGSAYDFFLFLDSQPNSGNISFQIPPGKKVGVIDHHLLNPNLGHLDFEDIRETYGATATIVYEYILSRNLKVDDSLATALYYAIRTETSDLGRGAGKADRDSYFKLHAKINWDMLHRIVNSRVSTNYFQVLHDAIAGTRIYRNALTSNLGAIQHADSVAEIADTFLRLEGIEWVLAYGTDRKKKELLFSLRSSSEEFHMGELARWMVSGIGTAGGHPQLAGGQVRNLDKFPGGVGEVEKTLVGRFLQGINNSMKVGLPLITPG